jgi:hypothetical protein
MEGKIKNKLPITWLVDIVRIKPVQDIEPFVTEYSITFFASTYLDKDGEEKPHKAPKEIDESRHFIDPRFIALLRNGINNSEFLNTPRPDLGGATPNQVLQTFNGEFVNYMEGMDIELDEIYL